MTDKDLDHLMIRKIQPAQTTTVSSSSENQEHSKLPSEVLRLGARIVRELELENSNDTLGRWMAHHLAELIRKAENTTGDARVETQERIVDLSLRLWAHRQSWSENAYSLKKFGEVVSLVWRLRPEALPISRMRTSETEDLLAEIFHRLQNVIVRGIILTSGIDSVPESPEEFEPFCDERENEVIANVQRWFEYFNADHREYVRISFIDGLASTAESAMGQQDTSEKLDLQSATRNRLGNDIDELIKALSSLKFKLTTTSR